MACIGIKISPKLNRIFKSKRRGGKKKKLEDNESVAEEKEEPMDLKKNNFYFSLEVQGKVHGKAGEVVILPSSHPQSNVYSWLYSQEDEECYSEHYPAFSSNSSPSSSSACSSASGYLTSRLSDPSFSPIQEENSFSKRSSSSRAKPPGSILSEPSTESSPNSNNELHYASTDILDVPWKHSGTSRNLALGEPTEYVYLDFSIPASDGWMVTRKPSHWPVRSAYI